MIKSCKRHLSKNRTECKKTADSVLFLKLCIQLRTSSYPASLHIMFQLSGWTRGLECQRHASVPLACCHFICHPWEIRAVPGYPLLKSLSEPPKHHYEVLFLERVKNNSPLWGWHKQSYSLWTVLPCYIYHHTAPSEHLWIIWGWGDNSLSCWKQEIYRKYGCK